MVLSMHPHAISADGQSCLYMQDTWLVTDDGGVPLAGLADEDLRRHGAASVTEAPGLSKPILCRPGSDRTTSATCAPTSCSRCRRPTRRVDPSRRAALPDGAPVVGAVAEARVERGRGGDAARRRRRRARGAASAAARERLLEARHGGARHARAHVAVGVHDGAQGARARQRLRLARLPRDPPCDAAARPGVRRGARAGRRCRSSRSTRADASSTRSTTSPSS